MLPGVSWGLGPFKHLQGCGGPSHSSAAAGWDGSARACLCSALFSFPSIQTWLESISPWTFPSLPKAQPTGVRGQVDFAPSRTPLSTTSRLKAGALPDFSVHKSEHGCD